jgi:hypothetical protein
MVGAVRFELIWRDCGGGLKMAGEPLRAVGSGTFSVLSCPGVVRELQAFFF